MDLTMAESPDEKLVEKPEGKAGEEIPYCPFCPSAFKKTDMLRWRSHVADHSSRGAPGGRPPGSSHSTQPSSRARVRAREVGQSTPGNPLGQTAG